MKPWISKSTYTAFTHIHDNKMRIYLNMFMLQIRMRELIPFTLVRTDSAIYVTQLFFKELKIGIQETKLKGHRVLHFQIAGSTSK